MNIFSKKIYYVLVSLALAMPAYAQLKNPIKAQSFSELVTAISQVMIAIGIPVAAVFIVYSGFLFVSARGSEEQIKKAKTTFFWAVLGTMLLVGAEIIATALESTITGLGGTQ